MKKISISFILILFSFNIGFSQIRFGDPDFKNALLNHNPPIDTNNNGEIDSSEIGPVTVLNLDDTAINDISEISYFTNLQELNLLSHSISTFNDEGELSNLKRVKIGGGATLTSFRITAAARLETIDISGNSSLNSITLPTAITSNFYNSLKTLYLAGTNIYNVTTFINISSLEYLSLAGGRNIYPTNMNLTQLTNLIRLDIQNSNILSINLSASTTLRYLFMSHNNLSSLDLTNNLNLEKIFAANNNLTSVILPGTSNLTEIELQNNNISTLVFGGVATTMQSINLDNNNLTTLTLPTTGEIEETLSIRNNSLVSIELKNVGIYENILLSNNSLTEIDICNGNVTSIASIVTTNQSPLDQVNITAPTALNFSISSNAVREGCSGGNAVDLDVSNISTPDPLGDVQGDTGTVQIQLSNGINPVENIAVSFHLNSGNATINSPSGTTDSNGIFSSTVSSGMVNNPTITAQYDSDDDGLPDTELVVGSPAIIQFINDTTGQSPDTGAVGINTVTPDGSSVLDVVSSNKGVLLPRVNLLSASDMVTIEYPAEGLLVFNTNRGSSLPYGFVFFNGQQWLPLCGCN